MLPLAPPLRPATEPHHTGAVPGHPPTHPTDNFGAGRVTLLSSTPRKKPRRPIRYDLLAGAALVLALLALVPLLLLRNDPEEIPTSTELPPAGGSSEDVRVELDTPTDLNDKVKLTWRATRELDFAVVVAEEGKKRQRILLAERNHSMTIDVVPGRKYCFLVQGSDGGDDVYESDPVPLRGATCKK